MTRRPKCFYDSRSRCRKSAKNIHHEHINYSDIWGLQSEEVDRNRQEILKALLKKWIKDVLTAKRTSRIIGLRGVMEINKLILGTLFYKKLVAPISEQRGYKKMFNTILNFSLD